MPSEMGREDGGEDPAGSGEPAPEILPGIPGAHDVTRRPPRGGSRLDAAR